MISVFTGCMKSGKTNNLVIKYHLYKLRGQEAILFKPDVDARHGVDQVISRNGRSCCSITISAKDPAVIMQKIGADTKAVLIDEGQFFADDLVAVVQELADAGIEVTVAGLDMDSDRKPFGPMPALMAIAYRVYRSAANCDICSGSARYSYANFDKQEQVVIGDSEYLALCDKCYLERC